MSFSTSFIPEIHLANNIHTTIGAMAKAQDVATATRPAPVWCSTKTG
ncbi:hypothetical protein [Ensifer canadensis]